MNEGRRGILLDIEGTTTPIRFVTDVLFPFARARMEAQIRSEIDSGAFAPDLERFREERAADLRQGLRPPAWEEEPTEARVRSVAAYALWLQDCDRKSTALKSVQGKIWREGYRSGLLKGEVYPDVPPALERWSGQGSDVRIFSSGSVLAQKLLFSSVPQGDLTRFLSGFFDTTTGAKTSPESYARIAAACSLRAGSLLFVSDVSAELDAARSAGMKTLLCVRPGNPPQPVHTHPVTESLAAI